MVRVLVVDDSAFMRKMISDLIAEESQFQVVATAKNGKEAIEKAMQLKPDVITMDIEMPEMNGLEALIHLMKYQPLPVIMMSSLTQEGADATIRALEYGAFDFIGKPSGSISLDIATVKSTLHEKIRAASRARIAKPLDGAPAPSSGGTVMTPPAAAKDRSPVKPPTQGGPAPNVPPLSPPSEISPGAGRSFKHLVAIGTSTGGPRALQHVLMSLPESFPAPIVIVQHMPPGFTHSLAQRLDSLCRIRVVEAAEGDVLQAGTAYIAPGGLHMRIVQQGDAARVALDRSDPRSGHRPSVDTLFESLLTVKTALKHIVLMTGMGSDGAKGMSSLHKQGVQSTIAESEQTCVVYGMPRSAVELQCVDYILRQDEIPRKLIDLVHGR